MTETLHTCPSCHTPNFTARGLTAHKCKGPLAAKALALRAAKEAATSPVLIHVDPSPEVTTEQPKRPEWEAVRETVAQITVAGRMFIRGQVRLGMLLAGLKKAHNFTHGGDRKSNGGIRHLISWAQIVLEETGMGRRQGDEFIRLYEATATKLKRSKTLSLPEGLATDTLVLFQTENALALTAEQWLAVDDLIGTLTTGETQASLLAELGIVPKPAAMPKPKGGKADADAELTAGQLAFHFFEGIASGMINARMNPQYKQLLHALPLHAEEENGLCLASLEAEARAMLADIEDVKQASAKPAKGRIVDPS